MPQIRPARAILALAAAAVLSGPAAGQMKEDPEFVKKAPTIGDRFPELIVYTTDGKEFDTAALRGRHTVISFGCLT